MSWAILLSASDVAAIGDLRMAFGIDCCLTGGQLWLRGMDISDTLRERLKRLPAIGRYVIDNEDALTAEGELVPHGYLPSGPWLKLVDLVDLSLAAPIREVAKTPFYPTVKIQLVRDAVFREPDILICSLSNWLRYVEMAPQIRLDAWTFAVNEKREVIVRGTPLPPLPGARWIHREGMLLPAGWSLFPQLSTTILRKHLGVPSDALVRLLGEKVVRYEIISNESFVKASRSAVRLTARGIAP